jgi:hypothetical protein
MANGPQRSLLTKSSREARKLSSRCAKAPRQANELHWMRHAAKTAASFRTPVNIVCASQLIAQQDILGCSEATLSIN